MLSALLRDFVGLIQTWNVKLAPAAKDGSWSNLCLAASGLTPLTFMTIHLYQLHTGDTTVFGPLVRPPQYLKDVWGIMGWNLFWTDNTAVEPLGARGIGALKF